MKGAAIRTNVWYRQFAPGSPYGTVRYKDELCEGRHPWLCPYEDWFRIQEVAQEKFRRSGNRRSEIPMEFKKRLICARCQRVMAVYYSNRFRDRSSEKRRQAQIGYRCRCRELNDDLCPCNSRILPSWKIIAQFGDWLEHHTRLPDDWQEKIRSRLLEQVASVLSGSERADILGRSGVRRPSWSASRTCTSWVTSTATHVLVEAVFYDPLEQRIVEVSIRQKYRDVLVSTSDGEMRA